MARLQLPFQKQIETLRRLLDRFGPRWFSVTDAGFVIHDDAVLRWCRGRGDHRKLVREVLLRLTKREVLKSMRHPDSTTGRMDFRFKVTDDGKRLITFYNQHDAFQRDLDSVLDEL